jgi:hypothetical protein
LPDKRRQASNKNRRAVSFVTVKNTQQRALTDRRGIWARRRASNKTKSSNTKQLFPDLI